MRFNHLILAAFLSLIPTRAYSCPAIDKIPDYNCDGKVVVSILGDSLVSGFGDTKNDNKGGYVLRAQKKLPHVEIINLGVAGLRTFEMFDVIDKKFIVDSEAIYSDYVILDVGRNDRWLFGTPLATYRNLKRANGLIKKRVAEVFPDAPPLVITANLMLPNRGSQGPWVKELNSIILRSNSDKNPADLRFDLVSKRLLSSDQIHPTTAGYDALSKTLIGYLQKNLPKKVKKLLPDTDGDKLPDYFETKVFSTDPENKDTDGDGIEDYEDVFGKKE